MSPFRGMMHSIWLPHQLTQWTIRIKASTIHLVAHRMKRFSVSSTMRALGSNNLPDCSNMCHESSGKALSQTIGIGKGTVHLEDFEQSDLILVIGQNPGTNHPRMLTALRDAKKKVPNC